jgi:dienelactone hydrolase
MHQGLFHRFFILLNLLLITTIRVNAQSTNPIYIEDVTFMSEGVKLAGTIYKPTQTHASVVIVHGSGQESRMNNFAELLAKNGISVLTYDKRGVGKSSGIYVGPEVGTNNIDSANINLLAKDASAALNKMKEYSNNSPIGLIGFSQAGWIIPIAAKNNPLVKFMVLFSCPTVTTLEQLRFQFYTNGKTDFWDSHSESNTREHIMNDPDRYQFESTDPKEKDIQIPVKLCIEQINALKAQGKPFEYTLFPSLGHSTAFANDSTPIDISIQWIKQKTLNVNKKVYKN